MRALVLFLSGAVGAILGPATLCAEAPYDVAWSRQIGTPGLDKGYGVVTDSLGNVFISGSTQGDLGGPNAGAYDAFLRKYDSAGGLLWSRQIGTIPVDESFALATDATGNAYITGATQAGLAGPSAGGYDAFLIKYDGSGNLLWSRQLGTPTFDVSRAVWIDPAGNALIAGYTGGNLGAPNVGGYDAFVAKYDSAGGLLWTRQIGTSSEDIAWGIATDAAGGVYFGGHTRGDLAAPNAGAEDVFLFKYSAAGAPVWSRQIGTTANDQGLSVTVDPSGNPLISGVTVGDLAGPSAGNSDAFLAKYDAAGSPIWARQIGSSSGDVSFGLAVDSSGNAYITGSSQGNLAEPNAGGEDVYLSKFDSGGTLLWSRQVGDAGFDRSESVAVDAWGNAYISGASDSSLFGPNAGAIDAVLIRFSPAPEPSTLTLGAVGLAAAIVLFRGRMMGRQ